ncbi:MAG: hypothetical protein OXD31_06930 [Chloroflexi bacterium]|nr:hypothetical protein [Chloroflexota bacterium]
METDVNGRVVILDLAGNDLVEHIPPELGELSELEVLELNSNLLTGTLPSELGMLGELEHMELVPSPRDTGTSIRYELNSGTSYSEDVAEYDRKQVQS